MRTSATEPASSQTNPQTGSQTDDSHTLPGITPATPSFAFPPYATYSDATASNAEIMEPYVLNLAGLFGEEADTGIVADSYAGQLYNRLAALDAQWFSGLYELYNYTPERLAALLGLPIESVTARSGVLPEFRNISLQVVNGDLQISGSASNRKEIISMANVLHYYGVLEDLDEMKAYAERLWNVSHHYTVSLGEVYYCDGSCQDADKSADGNMSPAADQGYKAAGAGEAGNASEAAGASGTASASETGSASETDSAGEAASASEASVSIQTDSAEQPAQTDPAQTDPAQIGPAQTDPAQTDSARQPANPVSIPSDNNASPSEVSGHDPKASGQEAAAACPGHVDCSILAMVKGIPETKGLFQSESAIPAGARENPSWPGWSTDTMAYVSELSRQDWYIYYGFNVTDFPMANPLSSQEIDLYMKLVPSDTGELRRGFIRYALTSVGKIPYYWGGKPSAPGYEGNHFGALTEPDEDGRLLRGLDCSGWINWVYWSVTGRGLGAESTGTLLGSGRPVSRDQLRPGDICIRTGPMSHVVIFLGWTEDGQMLCIQETTGNTNNVTVSTTASDWESFRCILD